MRFPSGKFGKFWQADFPLRPERFPFFYGWVIAVVSILGMCASIPGQTIGVSVFTPRLAEALNLSTMQLSVTYMLGTLLSAVYLSAGGRFFDRRGARQALVYSVFALGVVLFYLSFAEFFSALLGRVLRLSSWEWLPPCMVLVPGFALLRFTGQGMVTLSSQAMRGKWFNRRLGTVTAFSGVVISFMFSVAPIGFESCIRAFGWQGAWQVIGLFLIGLAGTVLWLFSRDNPEECGLEMDGGFRGKPLKNDPHPVIYRDYTLFRARRTFSFWIFTLMFSLNGLVLTAYAFHVLEVGTELGVSVDFILGLFVSSAFFSVGALFLVAWLTDLACIRIKYLLCLMAVTAGIGFFCLAFGTYPEMTWLHILGFGVSTGCFGSLFPTVYPRFFGRKHLGAISGFSMTMLGVASAVGPFLFSLAEAYLGGYRSGFAISGLAAAALALASLFANNPQQQR